MTDASEDLSNQTLSNQTPSNQTPSNQTPSRQDGAADPHPLDSATIEAEESSADATPQADRAPTPSEEAIADQLAAEVSAEVGEHAAEMNRIGAHVRGEGEIIPDARQ